MEIIVSLNIVSFAFAIQLLLTEYSKINMWAA